MSMNEFRRLAAKIDQHMQQLSAQDVNDAHTIINRMMGYVRDLHKIWVGTSDAQLIALSNEFPGFYRYALITAFIGTSLMKIFRWPGSWQARRFYARHQDRCLIECERPS